ncbi:MAG: hypothetical protein ACREP9_09850 [Candidatus Dormibacteraceae bacterium]
MPLEPGKSKEAFSHNVAAEKHAGKPTKQAVAIAYSEQRRTGHDEISPLSPAPAQTEASAGGQKDEFSPSGPASHCSLAEINARSRQLWGNGGKATPDCGDSAKDQEACATGMDKRK